MQCLSLRNTLFLLEGISCVALPFPEQMHRAGAICQSSKSTPLVVWLFVLMGCEWSWLAQVSDKSQGWCTAMGWRWGIAVRLLWYCPNG